MFLIPQRTRGHFIKADNRARISFTWPNCRSLVENDPISAAINWPGAWGGKSPSGVHYLRQEKGPLLSVSAEIAPPPIILPVRFGNGSISETYQIENGKIYICFSYHNFLYNILLLASYTLPIDNLHGGWTRFQSGNNYSPVWWAVARLLGDTGTCVLYLHYMVPTCRVAIDQEEDNARGGPRIRPGPGTLHQLTQVGLGQEQ